MTSRTRDLAGKAASFPGASIGVFLGSGLSGACDPASADAILPFEQIPGLSAAGVDGHDGEIRRSTVSGTPCLFVCGRKHYYEGNPGDITRLIEFIHRLGVRQLILTSAAGSLNKAVCPGELVLVDDIIDFQFRPTAAPGHPGPAVPAGASVGRSGVGGRLTLDSELRRRLQSAADHAGVAFVRGAAVTCAGPVYETPAEIDAFQRLGVSLVTMSGAPEVRVANTCGMATAMIALVTNWAAGISDVKLRHDDVVAAAAPAAPAVAVLIAQLIANKQDDVVPDRRGK
ncbi:MAG: purine-nucleoside phosphorylase [Candidatus Latescibacterota bacterium]|nr:MAG: purine-nucleoside phosphorylase [Candidatus Latescibacterota bacterium]